MQRTTDLFDDCGHIRDRGMLQVLRKIATKWIEKGFMQELLMHSAKFPECNTK